MFKMQQIRKFTKSLLIFSVLITGNLHGQSLRLSALFGNHMVLQQNSKSAIWGNAKPHTTIMVSGSWAPKRMEMVKADKEGNWKLYLNTPKAGGPYTLNITAGKESIQLQDVMSGEVWLCSGQSNMEIPLRGYYGQPIYNSNETIATSENPEIRLFTVQRQQSTTAQKNCKGNWNRTTPETAAEFSATAYYFGKMLQQVLHVPIGLISCNWGGSSIESWMDSMTLSQFPEQKQFPSNDPDPKDPQLIALRMFNGMLSPTIGFNIKGCIWYQGETNNGRSEGYEKEMVAMVNRWRELWNIGNFPFYYVQIAPYDYGKGSHSELLREAQMKAEALIPNSGMAVILDAGDSSCIHPGNKFLPGSRLAYWALGHTYGIKGIGYKSPTFRNIKIAADTVTVEFDNIPNGITSYGKPVTLFEIAGEDRQFYPAKAIVTYSNIQLTSPFVKKPVAVRYAFKNFIRGEVFNSQGLPLSSFRTDNWKVN